MRERAVRNSPDRSFLLHPGFSLMTSRTIVILLIFFFETLDHDAERSYYLDEVFFLFLKPVDFRKVRGSGNPASVDFLLEPRMNGGGRYLEFRRRVFHAASIQLYLFEDGSLYFWWNLMERAWHKNGIRDYSSLSISGFYFECKIGYALRKNRARSLKTRVSYFMGTGQSAIVQSLK